MSATPILKTVCTIHHTRHCSPVSMRLNPCDARIACPTPERKPSFFAYQPPQRTFVTKDARIVIPSENILKGITGKKIIELAWKDFLLGERRLRLIEIETAREAFVTGTTKQGLPVAAIDKKVFYGTKRKHGIAAAVYGGVWQLKAVFPQTGAQAKAFRCQRKGIH